MASSVFDLVQSAWRRGASSPVGVSGNLVRDAHGNSVRFWISGENGAVTAMAYRCTTCATLIALCERLRLYLPGMPFAVAQSLAPESLLEMLPEIPPSHQDRARLAVLALDSAIDSFHKHKHQ